MLLNVELIKPLIEGNQRHLMKVFALKEGELSSSLPTLLSDSSVAKCIWFSTHMTCSSLLSKTISLMGSMSAGGIVKKGWQTCGSGSTDPLWKGLLLVHLLHLVAFVNIFFQGRHVSFVIITSGSILIYTQPKLDHAVESCRLNPDVNRAVSEPRAL